MAEWPDITILLCTYDRYDMIRKTVDALIEHLHYPDDKVHLLVADDSTPGKYISRLQRLKAFKHWDTRFVSTQQNGGWGRNVNNGLKQVRTDYVFFLEDDYVLTRPLDLRVGVALLASKPHIGMLRYRGTAGSRMIMHHFEADIRGYLPDYKESDGTQVPGKVTYLLLDGGSQSLWVYSNGPHLKRVPQFHRHYGMYAEGKKLGATEESFAHVVKDRMKIPGAPCIGILPEWIPLHWQHIGRSYQRTDKDQGA